MARRNLGWLGSSNGRLRDGDIFPAAKLVFTQIAFKPILILIVGDGIVIVVVVVVIVTIVLVVIVITSCFAMIVSHVSEIITMSTRTRIHVVSFVANILGTVPDIILKRLPFICKCFTRDVFGRGLA